MVMYFHNDTYTNVYIFVGRHTHIPGAHFDRVSG